MSRKARIAVLVSGGGTNLQAILDAAGRGEIPNGEVTLVISDRAGAYALERAEKAGIPSMEINRKAMEIRLLEPLILFLRKELQLTSSAIKKRPNME